MSLVLDGALERPAVTVTPGRLAKVSLNVTVTLTVHFCYIKGKSEIAKTFNVADCLCNRSNLYIALLKGGP